MSLVFRIIVSSLFSTAIAFGQNLEIHYINVGWGDSVIVKGPDGTTVLLEAGNRGWERAESYRIFSRSEFNQPTGLIT